jgi:hypothetical protein
MGGQALQLCQWFLMDKIIETGVAFHGLSKRDVAAELYKPDIGPVKREVLRLTAAYLNYFHRRHGITAEEIRRVSPRCCEAVEAAALKQAAEMIRDPSLFLAIKELLPDDDK